MTQRCGTRNVSWYRADYGFVPMQNSAILKNRGIGYTAESKLPGSFSIMKIEKR